MYCGFFYKNLGGYMESIRELRRQLQEEKVHPIGWSRPWGYKLFQRGPSIYITRLLLSTRITPTAVTISGIVLGIFGCFAMLQFAWQWKLFGIFLLYTSILADKVDGEIARYKKIFSLRGIYWDEISHLILPPLFWISLTFGISTITTYELRDLFSMGMSGALALTVIRVVHSLAPQIYAKKYMERHSDFALPPHKESASEKKGIIPFIILVGKIVHQFQDFFIIVLSTAVVLVIEASLRRDAIFHPLLAYFVFGMSILFVLLALEHIIRKSLSIEDDISRIQHL